MHKHIRFTRRGFNLVGAAIVLGVVGLVIGGIWVAASSVSRNHQVNTAYTNIGKIIMGLQNLYGTQRLPTAFTDLTLPLIAAGVIPDDMVMGGVGKHNWGGGFEVVKLANQNAIYLGYYNMPSSACPDFVIKATGTVNDDGYGRFGFMQANISGDSSTTVPAIIMQMNPSLYFTRVSNACRAADGTATVTMQYLFPF